MASSGEGGPGEQYKGRIYTTTSKLPYKQDLPPKGGYAPISFKRIPAKQIATAPMLFGGYIAVQLYAIWRLQVCKEKWAREKIEDRAGQVALEPLLVAERDREYLKQLRKNREAEAELMKDVEGWEVGTYFGQPVYRTLPDDALGPRVLTEEYYVHASRFHGESERKYHMWMMG